MNFTIHAGERVAVVGPSGAGKSSVLTLLARFYDPLAGRIVIDGWDVRQVPQAAWRAQIGLVSQDSVLFDTTIRENIRLGHLDARPEAVEAAAALAGLQPLLATLPDGYDTGAGEGGSQLSGGQRQRVALARALLFIKTVASDAKGMPTTPGGINGGMMKRPMPEARFWVNYVNVASVETSLQRAQQLGATVSRGKSAEPGRGWFAIISDPQGNPFGLWQADPSAA